MSKKLVFGFIALVVCLLPLFAGGSSEQTKQSSDVFVMPTKISIGAAEPGGGYYLIGSGVATILNKVAGIDTTVQTTGGSVSNQQLVEMNEVTIGILAASTAHSAFNGEAMWAGKPATSARAMLPLYPGAIHAMARKGAGIQSIRDLEGKRVCLGPAGSTHDITWRKIFETLQIKPRTILNLPFSDALDQIRDLKADAIVISSVVPASSFSDFALTLDGVLIELSDSDISQILKIYPYMAVNEIPANTYPGQIKAIKAPGSWSYLGTHKDQPEELIYQLTKMIYENREQLISVVKSVAEGTIEKIGSSVNIPLHPGALRYMKEKGITVPANLIPAEAASK